VGYPAICWLSWIESTAGFNGQETQLLSERRVAAHPPEDWRFGVSGKGSLNGRCSAV